MAGIGELILGGALATAGGWFSVWQQGRIRARERLEQQAERRRESRREKAEVIFAELSRLITSYSDQAMYALRLANNDKPDAPAVPSVATLDALIAIYFPACCPLLDEFNAEMKTTIEGYAAELREKLQKGGGKDEILGIHILMSQDLNARAGAFSERLRQAMLLEVEGLW